MTYQSTTLKKSVSIRRVISIHYFEYMSNFKFQGESHDFWEFVCVDKGEIAVMSNDTPICLKRGNIFFHKPNEFHNVLTNGRIAPNLVVIGFECLSPCMKAFENQLLAVQGTEQALMAQIIIEARNAFSGRLNDPYQEQLLRSDGPVEFGAEQLIQNYLEELIIHLYRRYFSDSDLLFHRKETGKGTADAGNDTYNRIIRHLETHIGEQLTVEKICRANLVSRSQLQALFRQIHSCGVIDYFSKMKVDAAKQLIRNHHLNFTEISYRLGYHSLHYFSRQFKKISGMSPSEYASSIQSLSEPKNRNSGMEVPTGLEICKDQRKYSEF